MTPKAASETGLLLVVDDDEVGRYGKVRVLRHAGFEVIEAGTGGDALRMIAEHAPRLVLLDVNLPDVSGWEVCRRIKTDPATATLPVLQMSASHVTEADTVRGLEGGADACLTEPVEPPVLIATVRALLRARRAEEELRASLVREKEARLAAEAASQAKDEFLATLSHELRSPLSAILTWASLARSDRLDPARKDHALQVIERNTRLQVKMIEELLDVSRIVSGKMRLEVEIVDTARIARAALESIQPAADAKGVQVSARIAPGVGALSADPARIQQIMSNLLSNAVKFTPKGGHVELGIVQEAGHAVIEVADTGNGIAPEFLPHIFERFRQADGSTTRREGGLGIGLAIVAHLVDLHGGSVRAESAGIGKGAKFVVRLPVVAASTARVPRTRAMAGKYMRTATLFRDLSGVHILLVDDEDDAREAISLVLSECGARVSQASSVEAGLAIALNEKPDLIISDIAMPGEDGYSLIDRVRRSGADEVARVPMIALTAYSSIEDRRRIDQAGFDLQLAKPIEPSELTLAVSSLTRATKRD